MNFDSQRAFVVMIAIHPVSQIKLDDGPCSKAMPGLTTEPSRWARPYRQHSGNEAPAEPITRAGLPTVPDLTSREMAV